MSAQGSLMFWRGLPLRYVLLIALLVGQMVPAWLVLQDEEAAIHERLFVDLLNDRDRYAQMLAVTLREPLWQLAPSFGEPLLDTIMDDPRVIRIRVVQSDGGKVFLERERKGAEQPSVMSATRSIIVNTNEVGKVTIELSTADVFIAMQEAEKRFIWRSLLGAIATVLMVFVVLYLRLTRPIDRLVSQSEALAGGNLQEPMIWWRNDELGHVGRSLDDTRRALAELIGKLQAANAALQLENEERKRAETELAQHAQVLEERVSERTRDLTAANQSLSTTLEHLKQTQQDLVQSEKLAGLGRLVAGVAHELNTPIGNALITGTTIAEMVQELRLAFESGALKKSHMEEFLDRSYQGCKILESALAQAATLIANFKEVAVDQSSERRRVFDLATTLEEIVSTLRPRLKKTPLQLAIRVPPGITMDGYPGQLGRIIVNLVINAEIHAFEDRDEGLISIEAADRGESIELVVHDNGCGIPEQIRSRIFDPFFTTRMGRGGTGLGLNIVYNMVTQSMAGKIRVEEATPRGARFILCLPKIAPQIKES